MKKHLMSLLALMLVIGMAQAGPVNVSQAKYVGQQFVQANFEETRQSADLSLVYTFTSTRGEVGYYVFNVGNDGFVIISGDDNFRPIIGYSEEGAFDVDNMSPECDFYLKTIAESRSNANTNVIDPLVAEEWQSVMNSGRLISRNGGRGVNYLVQTKWDQSPAPFNSDCPYDAGSPQSGYHAYTGCVATAMAQVMKYWNHPAQGQGSNSYDISQPTYDFYGNMTYPGHPDYGVNGVITVNFGAATYDWANMLNTYTSGGYTPEQGAAVALISYHCGAAVNMKYGNYADEGSGTSTDYVPDAIKNHFHYSTQAQVINKPSANLALWQNQLKESFDLGWPVLYSGSEPNAGYGHAFICDGYDDNDLFHFNWGWGGSGDGMFLIEGIDYTSSARGVFNFVPTEVYNSTAQAPNSFTVTPDPNNALSATLSWKNPTKTLNNDNITSIDRVVVTRNGEVVYTEDNVTPGAIMTATDNSVPRFDAFNYSVYVIVNGAHGKIAYKNQVNFGPTCGWSIVVTQAAMNGFRGGAIHMYNACGTEFASVTTSSSNVQSIPVDMPLGKVSFGWSAPLSGTAFTMAFSIKNAQNQTVYTYVGSSDDMPEGIFFPETGQYNNTCGNEAPVGVATNCVALLDEENPNTIHVSWDPIEGANGYGYTVYRDNRVHRLIPNGTSFVDENVPQGGHCYYIGYLGDGGENGMYSNESCATAGACYAPTNIDYEYTGSAYKIKLKWEKPVPSDGLSGYYLFRKMGEDGEYTRVKLLGASATTYTDNSANQDGNYYYYKLYAYYGGSMDCTSAPANWIGDPNQFFIKVLYSTDGVNEMEGKDVAVFPNPTTNRFTVEGEGLNHVTVFNTLGQMVYDMDCHGESVDVNLYNVETGVYMVRVATAQGIVTKRITVIK